MQDLPYELKALIIDCLGMDNDPLAFAALKSTCSTCRTLVHACRKYLFAEMRFWKTSNPQAFRRAEGHANFISTTPWAASYVTGLSFDFHITFCPAERQGSVIRAIGCMQSVRRLRINCSRIRWAEFTDHSTSPIMFAALQHLFTLPSLTELHLTDAFGIPVSAVASWQRICRLHIHGTSSFAGDIVDRDTAPCLLEDPIRLHVIEYSPFKFDMLLGLFELKLSNGSPTVDLSSLKVLKVFDVGLARQIIPFLSTHGASNIEEVSFRNDTPGFQKLAETLSPTLPSLKRVEFVLSNLTRQMLETLVAEMTALSSDATGINCLEEICMTVQVNFTTWDLPPLGLISFFSRLALLLTERRSWPTLKVLDLCIEYRLPPSQHVERFWANLPWRQLGGLASQRMLCYACVDKFRTLPRNRATATVFFPFDS